MTCAIQLGKAVIEVVNLKMSPVSEYVYFSPVHKRADTRKRNEQ